MSATTAAAAAAPPPPPHSKPTKILACVHCQYRKIKCDRQQPCSNCIKAKIACKPSTPAPPHKRRRPNQDLLERLARCEQLLKQYADGNVPVQGDSPLTATGPNAITSIGNSQPVSSPPMKVEDKRIPTGKVVKEDGNDRFMDNYIRISFVDELAAMRNIIDCGDDESESSTTGLSPGNDADLFLGLDDMTIDLQELQPDLVSVFRLWQIFLDRVNPLTKIIHVPSMQSIVMNAANDIKQVPLSEQALLFAIYSMAVVSLNMQEVVQILGMTREEAISRYTRGTKLALARANFMKNYNMSILQALALYMLAINTRSENNSNWIMGGTVMRIAQKMGYHRDGEQFNLSPFDTEMRRRIWWHIHVQDIRNAMLSGLSHSWVTTNWDTKMPLNINDAEMSPSSMEPLVPRDGPTEMAFVLIIYTYQKFNSKTHPAFEAAFMAFRAGVGSNHESEVRGPIETYRALIDEVDAELAEFERKYVDPTLGGVQEAASIIRPMFIDKMKDIMTPMHEQPEWGLEIFDQLDSLFKAFVQTHTRNVAIYKRMSNSGFLCGRPASSQTTLGVRWNRSTKSTPICSTSRRRRSTAKPN
ncbi:hypothetical protein NPX13_g4920 [Xylaria arbuscula]|uniref:Zn(2)-C6 fungal-type domain-containing protein n=1 Tax=Xylaria arbuscula TaxID=114810 RepID=A0A9W8TLH0_9PEZI|nr:hypothetical protein NPX13_g4920 [Xylaria arbuscula]